MFDSLSPDPSFLSGDLPPGFSAPLRCRLPPSRSEISLCSPATRTITSPPPRRRLPPSRSEISSSSPGTDIISSPLSRRRLPPSKSEISPLVETLARLIERCWNEDPAEKPTFREIIFRLDQISHDIGHKKRWKAEKRQLFYAFLKQFLDVFKRWELDNEEGVGITSATSSPLEHSSQCEDTVGCSFDYPTEVLFALIEDVIYVASLVTESIYWLRFIGPF